MIFKKNMNTSTTMSRQQLDIAKRQLEIDQLDIDRRKLEIENTQLTKRQLPEWWAKFWSSHPRSNKDCESAVAVDKKSKKRKTRKRSVERERWSHEQGYQKGYTAGLEKASKKIDVLADGLEAIAHLHACELSIVLLLLVLNFIVHLTPKR